MKTKNPTIVSIDVRKRIVPMVINEGDFFYLAHFCEFLQRVKVVKGPTRYRSIMGTDLGYIIMVLEDDDTDMRNARQMFLGDLGIPGHAYDDRPCLLQPTHKEAHLARVEHQYWVANTREADDFY